MSPRDTDGMGQLEGSPQRKSKNWGANTLEKDTGPKRKYVQRKIREKRKLIPKAEIRYLSK